MIEVKIYADTVDQLNTHIANLAGVKVQTDDELLTTLRERMRAKGMVVQVLPFESPEAQNAQPPDKPRTRSTKPKPVEAAPMTDPPKPTLAMAPAAAAAVPNAAEAQGKPEQTGPTRADVIKALDSYASTNPAGQAGAVKIMERVGGFTSLVKVPADRFPALIEALAA